jgi:hypothetical protein
MSEIFDFFIQNFGESKSTTESPIEEDSSVINFHSMMEDEHENFDDSEMPELIKTEPFEESEIVQTPVVKTENDIPVGQRHNYLFKCRICSKTFSSRYAFTVHVKKHKKKCINCKLTFKTWKEVEDHTDFCSRNNGRIVILPRNAQSLKVKRKKLPFECQLCHRKYECFDHLFKQQFKRCAKDMFQALGL